jgi:hypothetical protein
VIPLLPRTPSPRSHPRLVSLEVRDHSQRRGPRARAHDADLPWGFSVPIRRQSPEPEGEGRASRLAWDPRSRAPHGPARGAEAHGTPPRATQGPTCRASSLGSAHGRLRPRSFPDVRRRSRCRADGARRRGCSTRGGLPRACRSVGPCVDRRAAARPRLARGRALSPPPSSAWPAGGGGEATSTAEARALLRTGSVPRGVATAPAVPTRARGLPGYGSSRVSRSSST